MTAAIGGGLLQSGHTHEGATGTSELATILQHSVRVLVSPPLADNGVEIMVEGRRYLLEVLAYYRQAITETRLDEVIRDIGLGVWRIDEYLSDVSPRTLQFTERRLLRVHDCVLRGDYTGAQIVLADLRAHVLAKGDERASSPVPASPTPPRTRQAAT